MAQVPYWWNRDRSSCRHLWYPITGLRRNAPRIVHLLASVLENGASHFTSKYPLLRVSFSLSFVLSSKKKSRLLSDSSEENDYSIPDGPLSIFVRLVNTGQGHGWIEAATNFVSVSTLGSTTHHHLLLLLLLSRTFPNFYYRQIDPISDYSPPPRVIRYRNRLHETRPRTTPSSAFLPSSLPSFARNMKKTGSWKIFSAARSLHFTSFGFFSFV